jgi:hypothetical protein
MSLIKYIFYSNRVEYSNSFLRYNINYGHEKFLIRSPLKNVSQGSIRNKLFGVNFESS